MSRRALFICCVVSLVATGYPALAATSENVLLVINDASPASIQVGEYYAERRAVPADHVVHLKVPATDAIGRADYQTLIEQPIEAWLTTHGLQDRILYIVLTKGVPLRIEGTIGATGTAASVDSELTLLYTKLVGYTPAISGHLPNPYYLGDADPATARPFSRSTSEIYLVTRLDGFTVADVTGLIDRALAPAQTGTVVLEQRATFAVRDGDAWLAEAGSRLTNTFGADRAHVERSDKVVPVSAPVLGYYSWGSNDPLLRSRQTGLTFVNGAIGATFVSTDARTFAEPPSSWLFSDPQGKGPQFAGSFQSLVGDLIRDGLTGVAGNVAEPFLDATVRPQILFPAYLSGLDLADAFYLSMPYLSWEGVVIGDPLCAPFAKGTPTAAPDPGIDPETEFPATFSSRRVALLSKGGLNVPAVKLFLKAEAHIVNRRPDVDDLLARAVDLEPRLTVANFILAARAEAVGQVTQAADRYRRILAIEPKNVAALNNLAFNLADSQHLPHDALPFALSAYQQSQAPVVADTFAWTLHLTGDDTSAVRLLEQASQSGDNADILIHAAIVHEALNDPAHSKRDLDRALALNPQLRTRADVMALLDRLKIRPDAPGLPLAGASSRPHER